MTIIELRIPALPLRRARRRAETGPTPERIAELARRDDGAAVRAAWALHRMPW